MITTKAVFISGSVHSNRNNRFLSALLILFATLCAQAADFRGQVVEKDSRAPIEGARVVIDQNPASDTDDRADRTTIFGFFEFASPPAGVSRVRVTRGGYLPFEEQITLGAETNRVIELTPVGPGQFDVTVSVADVMTGIPVPGVQIVARRHNTATGADGQDLPALTADAEGYAVFEGLARGHYSFQARPPAGWQAHQSPAQTLLEKHHHVTFLLKADRANLSVTVTGFNPVIETEGPLPKVFVDVTGLDPLFALAPGQSTNDIPVALHTRSGYTDDGQASSFSELPVTLPYRLEAKKLGYRKHDEILPPGQLGVITRRMQIRDYRLRVTLEQDSYADLRALQGLAVALEGLENSNTEGIRRRLTNGSPHNIRLFEGLLPGRYLLEVHGKGGGADLPVNPVFQGGGYVEIFEEGLTEFVLRLNVVKARIYGRMLSAETKVRSPDLRPSDSFFLRPKYGPMAAGGIQIIEAQADGLLIESSGIL